jgi:general secretion pathway protein L
MVAGATSSPLPPTPLVEIYNWWRSELAELFHRESGVSESSADPLADITIVRGGVTLGARQEIVPIQSISAFRSSRSAKALNVRLGPNRFIRRRLADHRIPLSRAYRMAELDVTANTPFGLKDVHILFFENQKAGRSPTDYCLVRRDLIDPVLAEIRAAGCSVRTLSAWDDRELIGAKDYVVNHFNDNRNMPRLIAKHAFTLSLIVMVCVSLYNAFFAIGAAARTVETKVEALEPGAAKARAAFKKRSDYLGRLKSLYKDRESYVPLVGVLEELSQILPDGSYIGTFSMQKEKIRISGFSTSAASLVAIIDSSKLLRNPKFTSAVVKAPGRIGEQFTMEIDVEHAD